MVENQELWSQENQDKHKYFKKHFRIRIAGLHTWGISYDDV